jgi:hypothetical protein
LLVRVHAWRHSSPDESLDDWLAKAQNGLSKSVRETVGQTSIWAVSKTPSDICGLGKFLPFHLSRIDYDYGLEEEFLIGEIWNSLPIYRTPTFLRVVPLFCFHNPETVIDTK